VVRTSVKTQAYSLELEKCLRKVLTDQVYTCVARKGAGTVSETISGPKLVNNRKLLMKSDPSNTSSTNKPFTSEAGEISLYCNQMIFYNL